MSHADQEIEGYVREKSRRTVGWAVLRHLSSLAASIENEERANARLLRRILWSLAVVVPCVLLLGIATVSSPKVAVFALLIVGGIILGAVMIAWSIWRSRTLRLERSLSGDEPDPPA
jgi:predicted permease